MKHLMMAAILGLFAVPALADGDGDAEAGETQFSRQCVACHVIRDADGEMIAGRNANVGPNLYGVVGTVPGDVEGFDFSDAVLEWGATGAVWDEENFVGYVMNPTDFIREQTGDDRARAKMAYQVRNEQHARDIWAFLVSIQPESEASD